MWTVRDEMDKDLYGTIARVAELGYQGIEFKFTGDQDPAKLRDHLYSLGIEAASISVPFQTLQDSFDEAVAFIQAVGSHYAMCPMYRFEGKEEYVRLAPFFDEAGMKFKRHGIQFGYHNHGHEFTKFDGEYGLELLLAHTNPDLVHAEIDVCFAQMMGLNPADFIMKYKGRCSTVHMKDFKPGDTKGTVEVGQGVVDVAAVYRAAMEAGASWFIVEQDVMQRPSLESAKMSLDYLKAHGMYK
jgi:sugar phosphate isomerase/epimerase